MQFLKDLFLAAVGLPLVILGIGLDLFSIAGFFAGDKAIAGGILGFGLLCIFFGLRILALRGRRTASRVRQPPSWLEDDDEGTGGIADRLDDWKQARRTYLTKKDLRERKAKTLFDASAAHQTVTIRYNAGDNPGSRRRIIPKQLFKVEGFRSIYLSAYDFTDKDDRTFKVRHIEID